MLIDSHCHLDQLDNPEQGIQNALDAGVKHMLCVCIDLEHFPDIQAIAHQHDCVSISVGLHPNVIEGQDPSTDELIELANDPNVVAIGETGLDYYRTDPNDNEWQRERFRRHIRAAIACELPLIIHTRMAPEDTLKIMREECAEKVGGVMHCFAESWEIAQAAMDLGFYISFSGIVTFKNAKDLQETAIKMPGDKILIETDCPYLAPVPHRGKPNEPAYVQYVAQKLAELRQVPLETIIQSTTENYHHLFKQKNPNAKN